MKKIQTQHLLHCVSADKIPLHKRFSARLREWLLAFTGVLILSNAASFGADGTNSVSGQDFPAFKIISERNIFNPSRRPGFVQRETRKVSKTDSFSLVGTLLHEDGIFAFFDGSDSAYKKVLKPGDAIGGCKVLEVSPDSVKLENGESQIDLTMGMQMRRQDEEKWQLVAGPAAASSFSSSRSDRDSSFSRRPSSSGQGDRSFAPLRRSRGGSAGRRTRGSSTNDVSDVEDEVDVKADEKVESDATTNSPVNDILKKMMEKREKELNK